MRGRVATCSLTWERCVGHSYRGPMWQVGRQRGRRDLSLTRVFPKHNRKESVSRMVISLVRYGECRRRQTHHMEGGEDTFQFRLPGGRLLWAVLRHLEDPDMEGSGLLPSPQGKFIRIHFGTTGKLASADIETCKYTLSGTSELSQPRRAAWTTDLCFLFQICWKNPESPSS